MLAKIALIPAAVYLAADVVPKIVTSGAEAIALTAAAIAGLIYLGRGVRRGWRKAKAFMARAAVTFDIVESTPANFKAVNARLDRHRDELERHGKSLDVLADSDKLRIKDALAGDERSPVDRRRSRPA